MVVERTLTQINTWRRLLQDNEYLSTTLQAMIYTTRFRIKGRKNNCGDTLLDILQGARHLAIEAQSLLSKVRLAP